MGKIKKQRAKKRHTIIKEEVAEKIPVGSKENAIQTIIDQLQAPNLEDKYCGLQTFALLVENPENIEEIFNYRVVRLVAPLLLNTTGSVRNAASGVLRNLSAGGQKVCEGLMEQDVMTPLTCFFHQFAARWIPNLNSKNKEDDETVINCINLLWNLCESSELAINYMGQSRILEILTSYLDLDTFGCDMVLEVLQCLLVLVEDNPEAIQRIKPDTEEKLYKFLLIGNNEADRMYLKTLAVGLLISLSSGNISNLPIIITNRLISVLAETLRVNHRDVCTFVMRYLPPKDASGKHKILKGKELETLETHLRLLALVMDAQQSAIEIVANLCSCVDNDEPMDESSDSDDMGEEEVAHGGAGLVYIEDKLPVEVFEGIVCNDVFDKVWTRTLLPPDNVMNALNEYEKSRPIYKKLLVIQVGALLCLNNMITNLPIQNLGGINGVYKIWVDAGKLIFRPFNDPDKFISNDLSESATAVMRAALEKIRHANIKEIYTTKDDKTLLSNLSVADVGIMTKGIRECQVPEVRANLIRMVGTLGLVLVSLDTKPHIIKVITEFLLEQAHREQAVWLMAETLDTLVDLYSEDETDGLASDVKLVEKLTVIAPVFKNKARQQRNLSKEHKGLISTVSTNLPRFITYKKERLSKL